MDPGTEIHVEGHSGVLNGRNAVVIADGPRETYFVTLPGKTPMVHGMEGDANGGIRAALPKEFIRQGFLKGV